MKKEKKKTVKMNFTLISAFVLLFAHDSYGLGGANLAGLFSPFMPTMPGAVAPPTGYAMGQEISKNAADFAIDNAIFKAGTTDLPPELQVNLPKYIFQRKNEKLFFFVFVFVGRIRYSYG